MKKSKLYIIFLIVSVLFLGVIGYLGSQIFLLKENILVLENDLSRTQANFASTTENLQAIIASVKHELAQTIIERDDFWQKYIEERDRMDSFSLQLSNIQGTVGTLEKLSQTDPELLKKYSKVYFLSENYIPESLLRIESKYTYNPETDYFFYFRVWPYLEQLMQASEQSSIDIKIISAYRSFYEQSDLKLSYKMTYGSGANRFSADQGYSEHQLGTTLDFTTPEIGATYLNFEKTESYQWLLENAYKYGFVLSYPEGNAYYQFEPWHWRFVGRALATKLHEAGKNFYDLDQREIDQYLISFFD